MAATKVLQVEIPAALADVLDAAVASGEYDSPEGIVLESLVHWTMDRAEEEPLTPDEMRILIQKSLDDPQGNRI